MLLPGSLISAIESLVAAVDRKKLYQSAEALSLRYRTSETSCQPLIRTQEERLAYLCTRLPATFAANHAVLSEMQKKGVQEEVHSVLDVGAGSGAALWAVMETLGSMSSYTLLERDPHLISLGQELLKRSRPSFPIEWICKDYTTEIPGDRHDLSIFSYSLGEVDSTQWKTVLERVAAKTKQLLIIIEPGTPLGYQKILAMRDILLSYGWSTVAPCPHNKPCPLSKTDWCHFSQRLPRTSLHKTLKDASLGYEDEKFSYIIMSKKPYTVQGYRVIKPPTKRSGYIELELCSTHHVILHKKASKRDKHFFNKAKKLSWGSFCSLEEADS